MVFINLNCIIFVPDQSAFLAISPFPKETKQNLTKLTKQKPKKFLKNKKKKQTNKKTPTKQTKTHTLELYVYIVLCFLIMEKIEIKNTPHILKMNTFIHVHVLGMYMGLCDKKMR